MMRWRRRARIALCLALPAAHASGEMQIGGDAGDSSWYSQVGDVDSGEFFPRLRLDTTLKLKFAPSPIWTDGLGSITGADSHFDRALPAVPASGETQIGNDRSAWRTSIEIGAESHRVSQGYGDGHWAYVRGVQKAGGDVWNAEVVRGSLFRDAGTYASVAWTHPWNTSWYSQVGVGGGSGEFYFPRMRLDVTLNVKRGPSLILTGGLGSITAKDSHRDRSLFAGGVYYLPQSWVLQGGVRWNESRPGGVRSSSGFVALTHGSEGRRYLSARATFGREAYQRLTPDRGLVDFPSRSFLVSWKQWLLGDSGFHAAVESYSNQAYRRTSVRAGVFHEWR